MLHFMTKGIKKCIYTNKKLPVDFDLLGLQLRFIFKVT